MNMPSEYSRTTTFGAGKGNTTLASLVSNFSGMKVNHQDISNFRHKRFSFIGRAKRKAIKKYFILQGYLPAPKPRKAPQCRNCGLQYPTRKNISFHATVENDLVAEFDTLATGQSNPSAIILQLKSPDKKVA